MFGLRNLVDGLRALARKEQTEREMDEELRGYLAAAVEEKVRSGMTREEALRAARVEMGSVEAAKEEIRGAGWEATVESIWQDLRYGVRVLRKNPGFTAVAVMTLALGIGANAAMFAVVNALLLRPLPFRDPGRLVSIDGIPAVRFNGLHNQALGWEDWVSKTRTLGGVAIYEQGGVNVSGVGEPVHLPAAAVSASFFTLLGVGPILGRTFLPQDDAPGQAVAVISHDLWQSYFGRDPKVVGKKIDLGGSPFNIVGVMAPGFEFPGDAQMWIPAAVNRGEGVFAEGGTVYRQIARLQPGFAPAQARAELEVFLKNASKGNAAPFNPALSVTPLGLKLVGDQRPAILVLMGAVTLVLLIACANVANLLMARNVGRAREVAIRAAIGASRRRLIRQMLPESVLLSLAGGLAGLAVAAGGVRLARFLIPSSEIQAAGIRLDGWVLGFMFAVAMATGILSGLLPALGNSRTTPSEALKESGSGGQPGFAPRSRLRDALGMLEIALALILLIGAGLLVKSLAALSEVNPGIRSENLVTARLFLAGPGYRTPKQRANFYEQVLGRARTLPGVREGAFVNSLPLGQGVSVMFSLGMEGSATPRPETSDKWAIYLTVSQDYFRAVGIPLVEGREFTERDRSGSPQVVIVSRTMARRFWPGEDPIGKRVTRYSPPQWATVVGVVGDVQDWDLADQPDAQLYVPLLQEPPHSAFLALHTSAPVAASDLAEAVKSVDAREPVASVETAEQLLAHATASPRFRAVVLSTFAGLALLLALVGIYGIVSYSASQRTHEFGIRLALGAGQREVMRMVLGQGLRLAVLGVAGGLAGAVALTRLLASFLYGVRPMDFVVFASAALVLAAVALVAVVIPARRATRVDPMVALRCE